MSELQSLITDHLPDGWTARPFWTLFRRRKETGFPHETLLSVYRDHGVVPKASRDDNYNKESDDLSNYQIVHPGDLVTNKMKAWQGSIAVSRYGGIVSPAYFVYKPLKDENDQFLHYLLRSTPYIALYQRISKGVRVNQWDLEHEAIRNMPVLLPDRHVQRAIADFLDCETARVDQLIEKKERMIEKIDERATSLTWTLVTGRELSGPPVTDSGFEWIGTIPSHWRAVRIKTVARLESGHTPSRSVDEYWTNPTIPWVSLADSAQLRRVDVITETTHMISEAGLAGSSARILPAGTVAFTRDATVGLAAILGRDMAVSQHLVGWVCGSELDPHYLLFVIYAMQHELNRLTWGATIKTIGMPDLRMLSCPLPPLDEQQQIVQRLAAGLRSSKQLRANLTESIAGLRERRSALITAAVTGQIDVATWGMRGETDRRLEAIEHVLEAEREEAAV